MKTLQTVIFSEVDNFLGYKNSFDHVAIIKYASLANISSPYLSNTSDIKIKLHKKDTLIGGGTDTPLAYRLFLDSLIDVHPNKKLSVILFSDFSGIGGSQLPYFVRKAFNKNANPSSTEEILSSLMENAYDKNVETNRIIYSEKIKDKRFTKRGKRQFYKLINSDFGKTYVINSLGSISSCLKEFMNDDCLTSRLRIPIDEMGWYQYRLTIANDSGVKQMVIEKQFNEVRDSLELNMTFSLDTLNYLNIEFETGSDKVSESSYGELNKVYDFMYSYPNISIQLQGHTDNKGSYEYNLDLSSRRAEAAKKYLLNKGIASSRLSSVGFGFTRPIDSNDTPEGRQRNRRTEFIVVEK
jgi:outer membrane protein OmpA-like peptidoglycan-associated protein